MFGRTCPGTVSAGKLRTERKTAPMSLLDHLSEPHQQLLESLAEPVRVARGQYLLRRGESGGDVYLVRAGALDIVDTRTTPEVIVAGVKAGDLLGELSFLDDAPRSADVRASADSDVLRWARDDMLALLEREPEFALAFWQAIARITALRSRRSNERVAPRQDPTEGEHSARDVRRLVEATKTGLLDLAPRLRHAARPASMAPDPPSLEVEAAAPIGGPDPQGELNRLLDGFEAEIEHLFHGATPERAAATAAILTRELTPYLVRSTLAERCLRKPKRAVATGDVLAHVLEDHERGEGRMGELLDRWLLDRPTLAALRAVRTAVTIRVAAILSDRPDGRVLVLNAGAGSLVAELAGLLAFGDGLLTVVDQSRTALQRAEEALATPRVRVRVVQESLVQLATGRARADFAGQDAVVIHGLLEYLPDRLAISLLEAARAALSPGGAVVAVTLAPTRDAVLLDRVLGWPAIRRDRDAVTDLFAAARLLPDVDRPHDALWAVSALAAPDAARTAGQPAPRNLSRWSAVRP